MPTHRIRLHVTLEPKDHRAFKVKCAANDYDINEAVEMLVTLWLYDKVKLPRKGLHGAES